MPLVLYTDTFLEVADADIRLDYDPCWSTKTLAEKEALLKAISFRMSDMTWWGTVKVVGQAMSFPRSFSVTTFDIFETGENVFTEEMQEKRLRKAVLAWVVYSFSFAGTGLINYGVSDESITPRLELMPREAMAQISPYLKA